jgi:hypothetical protein
MTQDKPVSHPITVNSIDDKIRQAIIDGNINKLRVLFKDYYDEDRMGLTKRIGNKCWFLSRKKRIKVDNEMQRKPLTWLHVAIDSPAKNKKQVFKELILLGCRVSLSFLDIHYCDREIGGKSYSVFDYALYRKEKDLVNLMRRIHTVKWAHFRMLEDVALRVAQRNDYDKYTDRNHGNKGIPRKYGHNFVKIA